VAALARSITMSKWASRGKRPYQRVRLDGVTHDFRTMDHALSFWICDQAIKESVDDVALVAAANRDSVQKLWLILLDEGLVRTQKIRVQETPGETKIEALVNRHRDIVELSVTSFGKLARTASSAIAANGFRVYSEARVLALLSAAVADGRLGLSDLKPGIQSRLANQ
jgi:hypothetical protein